MNIPQSVIEPFGYTGMPQLYSKEILENTLAKIISEIADRINRENAASVKEWYNDPRLQVLLKALDKIKHEYPTISNRTIRCNRDSKISLETR